MAITINDKVYRNLEEQVEKNTRDIEHHYTVDRVIGEFGIHVKGQRATRDDIPLIIPTDVDYPRRGDAWLIGTEEPYDIYIWTEYYDEKQQIVGKFGWINIGKIAVAGPQGPKGDKGEKGDRGLQGLQGIQGIKGEQGVAGPKGDTGDRGPKGDKGDIGPRGETGDLFHIYSSIQWTSNLPQLPTPSTLEAYLVKGDDLTDPANPVVWERYHLFVQEGQEPNQKWKDVGPITEVGTDIVDKDGAFIANLKATKESTGNTLVLRDSYGDINCYGITANAIATDDITAKSPNADISVHNTMHFHNNPIYGLQNIYANNGLALHANDGNEYFEAYEVEGADGKESYVELQDNVALHAEQYEGLKVGEGFNVVYIKSNDEFIVDAYTTVNSELWVNDSTTVTGEFTVNNDTYLNGNADIGQTAYIKNLEFYDGTSMNTAPHLYLHNIQLKADGYSGNTTIYTTAAIYTNSSTPFTTQTLSVWLHNKGFNNAYGASRKTYPTSNAGHDGPGSYTIWDGIIGNELGAMHMTGIGITTEGGSVWYDSDYAILTSDTVTQIF